MVLIFSFFCTAQKTRDYATADKSSPHRYAKHEHALKNPAFSPSSASGSSGEGTPKQQAKQQQQPTGIRILPTLRRYVFFEITRKCIFLTHRNDDLNDDIDNAKRPKGMPASPRTMPPQKPRPPPKPTSYDETLPTRSGSHDALGDPRRWLESALDSDATSVTTDDSETPLQRHALYNGRSDR